MQGALLLLLHPLAQLGGLLLQGAEALLHLRHALLALGVAFVLGAAEGVHALADRLHALGDVLFQLLQVGGALGGVVHVAHLRLHRRVQRLAAALGLGAQRLGAAQVAVQLLQAARHLVDEALQLALFALRLGGHGGDQRGQLVHRPLPLLGLGEQVAAQLLGAFVELRRYRQLLQQPQQHLADAVAGGSAPFGLVSAALEQAAEQPAAALAEGAADQFGALRLQLGETPLAARQLLAQRLGAALRLAREGQPGEQLGQRLARFGLLAGALLLHLGEGVGEPVDETVELRFVRGAATNRVAQLLELVVEFCVESLGGDADA